MASSSSIVKRPRVELGGLRALVAHDKQTKTSLADTLTLLQKQGRLTEGATKRQLQHASEFHAKQNTPYGQVVQKLEVNLKGMKYLDFVNPLALLHYLTVISEPFSRKVATSLRSLRL